MEIIIWGTSKEEFQNKPLPTLCTYIFYMYVLYVYIPSISYFPICIYRVNRLSRTVVLRTPFSFLLFKRKSFMIRVPRKNHFEAFSQQCPPHTLYPIIHPHIIYTSLLVSKSSHQALLGYCLCYIFSPHARIFIRHLRDFH